MVASSESHVHARDRARSGGPRTALPLPFGLIPTRCDLIVEQAVVTAVRHRGERFVPPFACACDRSDHETSAFHRDLDLAREPGFIQERLGDPNAPRVAYANDPRFHERPPSLMCIHCNHLASADQVRLMSERRTAIARSLPHAAHPPVPPLP